MGNAARKPKTESPSQKDSDKSEGESETQNQRGLFSTLTKEEVDILRALQREVKDLQADRDNWRNKASELQEEMKGKDRYIQGTKGIIDRNVVGYQKFMDELMESRKARHKKIEELDRRLENLTQCKICYNDYDDKEHLQLALIPCGHFVCKKCCDRLLRDSQPKCFCRQNIAEATRVYY